LKSICEVELGDLLCLKAKGTDDIMTGHLVLGGSNNSAEFLVEAKKTYYEKKDCFVKRSTFFERLSPTLGRRRKKSLS
jgi:hypothetical protein